MKRKLIAFAPVCLALVFTTQAFGQSSKGTTNRRKSVTKKTNKALTLDSGRANARHRLTKPVNHLDTSYGGMDPTGESPEFGSGARTAKPKDLVKNKIEAKPKPTNVFLEGGNDSWNTRKKPGQKRRLNLRKKPKNTRNLLPYLEQNNLYRRRKPNK